VVVDIVVEISSKPSETGQADQYLFFGTSLKKITPHGYEGYALRKKPCFNEKFILLFKAQPVPGTGRKKRRRSINILPLDP
jgi:hypothetical protein